MFEAERIVLEILARDASRWMNAKEIATESKGKVNRAAVNACLLNLVRTGSVTSRSATMRLEYKGEGITIPSLEFRITNNGIRDLNGSGSNAGLSVIGVTPGFSI